VQDVLSETSEVDETDVIVLWPYGFGLDRVSLTLI
jgi:hypothetical protein